MKKTLIAIALACSATAYAQDKLYPNEFPLGDVTITGGVLKHARDLNIKTLLQYDVDKLLAPYRKEAGLDPRKPSYKNWDGLDGHVGGHYLTAMAINAATGDKECEARMLYMIKELKECAEASAKNHPDWGVGYLGGVPNSNNIWSKFKKGDFSDFNGAWVPLYNIHKMYAGLRDAWVYCGNEDAKALFLGFCDWAVNITSQLSDEQMERMLGMEHGGMNEVIADAYYFTGDKKYLDCAKRFSHKWIMNPMAEHNSKHLDNIHANTQVPKIIGFERVASIDSNADSKYRESALFFWDEVVNRRSLSVGGNSRREHFPSKESCIDWTQDVDGLETCNTNNMLKLTEMLFMEKQDAKFADFYERATFNHILSSQHPEHGGYVYFTSARPRHYRNYSVPNEAMWCCVGTGMENHGKYGQFIYTKSLDSDKEKKLFVNLFVPSELNWRANGIKLTQETEFPYGERTKLKITKGKKRFELNLRYPSWVRKGELVVIINGKRLNVYNNPGSYISITRTWRKGDTVEMIFPMHNSIEHMPNVPQYVALLHGPITLAMKTGTEDLALLKADDSRFGQIAAGKKLPVDKAPYLLADQLESIVDSIIPVPGEPLHFTLKGIENKQGLSDASQKLIPFFELHDARYMLYWLALSKDGYKDYLANLAKEEEERLALDAATTDKVQPGEQQPESDHFMETDDSYKGVTNDVPFRDAQNGHFFSYQLQTKGETDLGIRIRYWGQDEWRTREYDIFVDDVLVKEVRASKKWRSSQWKYETYPIPAELLKGKSSVRIKFVANPHRQIGEIYEVRLVKNN